MGVSSWSDSFSLSACCFSAAPGQFREVCRPALFFLNFPFWFFFRVRKGHVQALEKASALVVFLLTCISLCMPSCNPVFCIPFSSPLPFPHALLVRSGAAQGVPARRSIEKSGGGKPHLAITRLPCKSKKKTCLASRYVVTSEHQSMKYTRPVLRVY